MVENGSKRSIKAVFGKQRIKLCIFLECSVMLNYQLEIVVEEFITSIGHSCEFYENLLFDRSIYRPMCTHMGNPPYNFCPSTVVEFDSFDHL